MGVYSREVFGGELTPAVGDQGASTACGNNDASHPLACAVIETMIEGYLAFSAANDSITTLDQAKQTVSTITKELVDNGDISATHIEHILAWVNRHYTMFNKRGPMLCSEKKLLGKILENCDASECPDIAEVQKLKAQLCAAKAKALAKYGPAICKEIMAFIQRYGKSFDQTYIKEWSDICGATSATTVATVPAEGGVAAPIA